MINDSNIKNKNLDNRIENFNKKQKYKNEKDAKINEEIYNFQKKNEEYKRKQDILNKETEKYNNKIKEINGGNINIKVDENEGKLLQKKIDEMKKEKENLEKERIETNKKIEDSQKETVKLEEEKNELEVEIQKSDKEKNDLKKKIEESNKITENINKEIEILNDLKVDDFNINFENDNLEIKLNKKIDLPDLKEAIKKIKKDGNISYQKELEEIAEQEVKREENKKNNIMRNEIEQKIQKILKEKNFNWDNCFNKSFLKKNYLFNIDDISKIVQFHLKNEKEKLNCHYIRDSEIKLLLNEAKNNIQNNNIILGNFYDKKNKLWSCFSLIKKVNTNYFLYKCSNGTNPPENLLNFIKKFTNNNYICKVNKICDNNNNKYSDIDSIENIEIIYKELIKDEDKFIQNFENYKLFFKGDNIKKKK